MRVGTSEWEDRYAVFAGQAGLPSSITYKVHPEIEQFCLAELDAFDKAVKVNSQKVDKFAQNLRCCVADPLISAMHIEATTIPFIAEIAAKSRKTAAEIESAKEFRYAGEVFLGLYNEHKKIAESLEALAGDAEKRLPEFNKFVSLAYQAIVSRANARKVALPQSYNPWQKQEDRDKVYRAAASGSWCIGWNVLFMLRDTVLMMQKNELSMKVYESAKAMGQILPAGITTPVFGNFDASPEAVAQCLSKLPSASEVQELESAVTAYYDRRKAEIFR